MRDEPLRDGPLRDIRVLDLSRLLPGPFCTLVLSDLGARVDKLEDPHAGDYLRIFPPSKNGLSGRFIAINRDKRSLSLDLKQAAGRDALLKLVRGYDVVVESFRPGVLDKLGVGYAALSSVNPKLVVCSISGYGQTGPMRDRAGHDLNYIALAGVLGMTGERGGNPVVPGVQIADVAGGALWGAVGILAALHEARATGKGAHVDVSMCEGALAFMMPDLGNLAVLGKEPVRGAELLNGGSGGYGVFRTSDGKHLSVGALEPKFWGAFNQAIGRKAEMNDLIGDAAVQERVRAEVQAILGTRTRNEWEAVFAGVDACVEPVLSASEVLCHPQHVARELFFEVDGYAQVRTPLGKAGTRHTAPPSLGQHSVEILVEGGFDEGEIQALRQSGAIPG